MSSYPRSLQYLSQRLVNYHRQALLLMPRSNSSARPGSLVSVTLPENTKVDLRTFAMHFKGETSASPSGATSCFPKHIETIIDRISVDINGQTVDPGCSFSNILAKILFDFTMDPSMDSIRNVGMSGSDIEEYPDTNSYADYCITNWLGFLHASPPVIDTAITGPITINLYLAPETVLVSSANAASFTYALSDVRFTIDAISLDDMVYDGIIAKKLEQGPVPISFPRWVSFMGSKSSSASTGMTFGVSAQSVDMLVGTLMNGKFNLVESGHYDPGIKTSTYFRRGSHALTGSQFTISGVTYPSFQPSVLQSFTQTVTALGINQSSLGGADKNLNSYERYRDNFFAHCIRLNHPETEGSWTCGMDTRGAAVSMAYNTQGGPTTTEGVYPLVFVGCTSTLYVGAFKQLQVSL